MRPSTRLANINGASTPGQKFYMNSLFWNIRGICAPGRKSCILDTLAKTHATIVGFQETKQISFTDSFLKSISGNSNFSWNFLLSVGSAGGILMGVDLDLFDITSWEIRDFSISCYFTIKSNNAHVRFITVYGSPYDDGKETFISKLQSLFLDNPVPTLIGGDFNLVRSSKDKNNGNVNQKWCDNFNAWIEIWRLLEVKLSSRKFTWANNQTDLIMSTIDRIFCSTEFESIFPLSPAQALPRLGSDHIPIPWESGIDLLPRASSYKFEKWWLLRTDFKEIVFKSWSAPTKGHTAIEIWQEKTRRFRKTSKGWSRNIEAALRNLKKDMMEEYDLLDIKSENTPPL